MTDFYKIGIDARAARMQRLALEALKAWDITDCEPELIKIRENAVFRIRRADGFDAALRIHRYVQIASRAGRVPNPDRRA